MAWELIRQRIDTKEPPDRWIIKPSPIIVQITSRILFLSGKSITGTPLFFFLSHINKGLSNWHVLDMLDKLSRDI